MALRKTKRWLGALAFIGVPLVVAASCDPYGGASFYRDDDSGDYCYGGCGDGGYWYDPYYYDPYYYDPYYYDPYYYEEVIFVP